MLDFRGIRYFQNKMEILKLVILIGQSEAESATTDQNVYEFFHVSSHFLWLIHGSVCEIEYRSQFLGEKIGLLICFLDSEISSKVEEKSEY